MSTYYDLCVIGAGPAGMSAAIRATRLGLSTLVAERQPGPGGQIFRSAESASPELLRLLGHDCARGRKLIRTFRACGAEFWPEATVWGLEPGAVYVSRGGRSRAVRAGHVLIATGAMERPVPVPGWTLPGVLGAGAADVLLKSSNLRPEGPVVLVGNGPLLVQSVHHLKALGVPVSALVTTGSNAAALRALPLAPAALLRPAYFAAKGALAARVLLGGAPRYSGARDIRITGRDGDFTVTFRTGGRVRSVQGATVLLHEGVVPETRATQLAGCRHDWHAKQRHWYAAADVWGRTSVTGVSAAGDCAGVLGADAAMARGRLAALNVCREAGRLSTARRDALGRADRLSLVRIRAAQRLLDTVFAVAPEVLLPADEAVVCRCEELTAGELRTLLAAGCASPDGLKAQSRAGMGPCQGRMCGQAVAEMIAQASGIPLEDLAPYRARMPLFPLSFDELAEMALPPL